MIKKEIERLAKLNTIPTPIIKMEIPENIIEPILEEVVEITKPKVKRKPRTPKVVLATESDKTNDQEVVFVRTRKVEKK